MSNGLGHGPPTAPLAIVSRRQSEKSIPYMSRTLAASDHATLCGNGRRSSCNSLDDHWNGGYFDAVGCDFDTMTFTRAIENARKEAGALYYVPYGIVGFVNTARKWRPVFRCLLR